MKILLEINQESNEIILYTKKTISNNVLKELSDYKINEQEGFNEYTMPFFLYNTFVIFMIYKKNENLIAFRNDLSKELFLTKAESCLKPTATVQKMGYLLLEVPNIPSYVKLLGVMNARHNRLNYYSVPFSRLYEAYRFIVNWKHPFLPKISFDEKALEIIKQELGKENSFEELMNIDLYDLHSIKYGYQIDENGFEKLNYSSAVDLLFNRPRLYVDRTEIYKFNQLPFGKSAYVKGEIISFSSSLNGNATLVLSDGYTTQKFNFWGQGFLTKFFKAGDKVLVKCIRTGNSNYFNAETILSEEEVDSLPIAPVYKQSPKAKITTKVLTNSVQELFLRFNGENLANYITFTKKPFWKLLEHLHFPISSVSYQETIDELAKIEMFYLQLMFLDKKDNSSLSEGVSMKSNGHLMKSMIENLPYELTKGQKEAIKHVLTRMNSNIAGDMLLSGDVGSGKSTVAVATCLYAVDSGYQACLVGPTEILAKQLYDNFIKSIDKLERKPNVQYLSGNTKAKEKSEILRLTKMGLIDVLVGTHAVFNAEFQNLGFVVIDEQQKFGASQRASFEKSRKDGKKPDVLAQTATPIPRSTALAFYGDVDLINLKEKPAKRKENITKWIKMSSDNFLKEIANNVWSHIYEEIEQGRQVFVVTPAVSETAKSASVEKTKKILSNRLPGIKIDYIHGSMTKEEQNKKILKFRDNKTNVLIASSIIEVGIDIPNATIMLVLDANRFGASSLHQIRGRVGRSELQGYCYLVAEPNNEQAEKRLQSLVDSNDGFDIALVDLETRQEGDLFGVRQSGESTLKFCDLINHADYIEVAKEEAIKIYNSNYKEKAIKDAKLFLKQGDEEVDNN